jgi:hypothetical protein
MCVSAVGDIYLIDLPCKPIDTYIGLRFMIEAGYLNEGGTDEEKTLYLVIIAWFVSVGRGCGWVRLSRMQRQHDRRR